MEKSLYQSVLTKTIVLPNSVQPVQISVLFWLAANTSK